MSTAILGAMLGLLIAAAILGVMALIVKIFKLS